MKKGKVFGKGQVALAVMIIALGAAVWLNMKFSNGKYLGEASYVSDDSVSSGVVQTGASVKTKDSDYFAEAKKDREKAREDAEELITETLKSNGLTDADKATALAKTKELADRIEKESNIESLLKAKGFNKAVAIIGDDNVSIVVQSDGLTTAQTLQIQDIVTGQTKISLGNIKILPVK